MNRSKVAWLTITFAIAFSLSAHAHQSVEWPLCECDPSPTYYTLTVFSLGNGVVGKSPDKPTYQKGEFVVVSFQADDDHVFESWICDPPSHLASNAEVDTVGVLITGNTTLIAVSGDKHFDLNITWDPSLGTVTMPQGAQGGNGLYTGQIDFGDILALDATPNTGYYTVWQGQGGSHNWSGERYEDSVDVKIKGSAYYRAKFLPIGQYPGSMNMLSVLADGGTADIFCAGVPTISWNAGNYLSDEAIAPGLLSFNVSPEIDYVVTHISWEVGGSTKYVVGSGLSDTTGADYTAHIVKEVKLNIETEGQGVVSSPDFKYSWNPQPYQATGANPPATALTPLTTANEVTLSGSPCPGWILDHWEYKDAAGGWVEAQSVPSGSPLKLYMNWWNGAGIHVPNGKGVMDVKAVFSLAGYGMATMPYKFKFAQSAYLILSGERDFEGVVYDVNLPTYCCEDHRDPDGNKYQHAHLPHGFPFESYPHGNAIVTQQMSDWAWDSEYEDKVRQSNSTFELNCYAHACDAPTVMFHNAWLGNFTLPVGPQDVGTAVISYGDEDHVVRITEIVNHGTSQDPDFEIISTSEKNGSGGVYDGPPVTGPEDNARKCK